MSFSAETSSLANSLLGVPSSADGIIHELSALSVFVMSFWLWHYSKTYYFHGNRHLSPPAMKMSKTAAQPDSGLERVQVFKAPAQDGILDIEMQICDFLQNKEFTRALYLFRSLERSGRDVHLKNEEFFSNFVVSAIRVGKFDVVENLLRTAKRNGVEPTLKFWRTILKMLSTKKQFSVCLLAYSIFEEAVPADKVVFSCLINAALDSNVPQQAAKILSSYRKSDVSPKEWILFFRTYVAIGDVDQAEATFHEAGTGEITPLMLNLLLLTCVNAKQLDRAEKCLQRAHVLEQTSESKIVNSVSYNTVIKGFAQIGQLDRCFGSLQKLFEHGLDPDETTVGMVVDICLQDDCVGVANRLMTTLRQSGKPTNTVMCTHFLKLLIRTERLEDAAELYSDMKRSEQTRPDTITCSLLIKAYVTGNELERALSIFEEMLAAGCKPDDVILTCLLDGCRLAGQCARSVALFDRFVKMGVVPSEYAILALLKTLGTAGDHAAAHQLVATCQQRYGISPSVIHYTCLMSGALRSRSYEDAWQAYLLMCQHGVKPDATTVKVLLPGLVAAQHFERAVEIVSAALKDVQPPLSIPAEMLNSALSQMMASDVARQHTLRLQVLMRSAGTSVSAPLAS